MPLYKLFRGSHWENREKLSVGDTLEMSQERFIQSNLGDRFREVPSGNLLIMDENTGAVEEENKTDWSFITSKTVPSVVEIVNGLDSIEELLALRAVEVSHNNRKGVMSAIDQRLEDLS